MLYPGVQIAGSKNGEDLSVLHVHINDVVLGVQYSSDGTVLDIVGSYTNEDGEIKALLLESHIE
jgi:hypothetical protein